MHLEQHGAVVKLPVFPIAAVQAAVLDLGIAAREVSLTSLSDSEWVVQPL